MKTTMMLAAAGAAALLLAGCSQGAPQGPTQTVTATVTASPSPNLAKAVVDRYADQLLEHIQAHTDGMCVNDPTTPACTGTLLNLGRLSETAMKDLQSVEPWPAEVRHLASTTETHLAGVASLAESGGPPSMMHTQLGLLKDDLRKWSAVDG